MSTATETIEQFVNKEYEYGFVTDVEADAAPRGLSEDTVRLISKKKNEPEWLLEWRLKAFRYWLTMKEPTWQNAHYPKIDFQNIIYYSAPKKAGEGPAERAGKEVDKAMEKAGQAMDKATDAVKEATKDAAKKVESVARDVSDKGTTATKDK